MGKDNKKRVFSGLKPSGEVHLGNYIGAIKNWVSSQEKYDNIFCVVDLHAITVKQEPKDLKRRTRELAAVLLASGIDAEKSTLFIQSRIPAHSELAWVLSCFIPMGWMEKMTQFKEKSEEGRERASVGLFDYPALMTADILLYDTDIVPVGEDQKQHVELARDVARRFNSIYGDTFKLPKAEVNKNAARVMGLQNPSKKMSKSEVGPPFGEAGDNNIIYFLDKPDDISAKIMKAETDSFNEVRFDTERPGVYNLLTVYESFSGLSRGDIETNFEGKGYAVFKKDLVKVVVEGLKPLQNKYKEIMKDPGYIEKVLEKGVEKALPLAKKKLEAVKQAVGLG